MKNYIRPGILTRRDADKAGGNAPIDGLLDYRTRDGRALDDNEIADPDAFIWNRPAPRTISFGLGQHHCIGKHLALLEMRIMVEEFLGRVPRFRFLMDEARRNPSYFQHGRVSLPVVVG